VTDLTSFRRLRLARSSDRIGEIVEDDNGGKPALTVLPFQFSNLRRLHRLQRRSVVPNSHRCDDRSENGARMASDLCRKVSRLLTRVLTETVCKPETLRVFV